MSKNCSFLKHINSQHPTIQFTMEMEKDRRIPFLDVIVNRRIDGSLGHEIYRKPTHTDRYLIAHSRHHPSQKASLVATLLHRAYKLLDAESLAKEKEHLITTLKRNGYNRKMILKRTAQVEKRHRTRGKEKQPSEKPETYAHIPYVAATSEKISRILKKNIVTRFKCVTKINQIIPKPKHKIPNNLNEGVYRIPCSCGKSYIGETCRSIKIRLQEHKGATQNKKFDLSAVAEHEWSEPGHNIIFDEAKIIAKEKRYYPRRIREPIEIIKTPKKINREDG
ncbi:uncharacterized protein LOC124172509 [Ischnura elegans]|uniref:uncharacterized protein LOC124172509 n=1 Tax=Ischnura elegans TaxID=197161 RepID=UPI001ED890A2|nr:uncharacterized protein LOC124172509 [Ischnura elegans]